MISPVRCHRAPVVYEPFEATVTGVPLEELIEALLVVPRWCEKYIAEELTHIFRLKVDR